MRRPFVAGNWKMNLNLVQMRELVPAIRAGLDAAAGKGPDGKSAVEVAVCPSHAYLFPMAKALAGSPIAMGAQDCFHETSGAFTGETSAAMIADTGCRYVILGHSERRHTIGHLEDDRMINLKLRAAIAAGLTPIVCVGETLAERKAEKTLDVLAFQLTAALINVELKSADQLVIAYEPVWAIGTGLNATPDQAQEAQHHLRLRLARLCGTEIAEAVRILYGGSLNPGNAPEMMKQPDVDGGLVGGASLKADSFLGIISATREAKSGG